MYRFKGFAGIRTLVNNNAFAVAAIGELSASAKTYAKDVRVFGGVRPDVQIYGFSSKEAAIEVPVPDSIVANVTEIAEWVVSRQATISVVESLADFRLAITNNFADKCAGFEVGELVTASNGKLFPSYLSWGLTTYSINNFNTLFFSNDSFEKNYDEYEITVVPPIMPLDSLFLNYVDTYATIVALSYTKKIQEVQAVRRRYPETILTAETYDYYNPTNPTVKNPTDWTFIIHGPRGNDPDAIRTALLNYISQNSSQGVDKWQAIYPDIFKTTEFLFLPFWRNIAIREMTDVSSIYSPVCSINDDLAWMKTKTSSIPVAHHNRYAGVMARPYKSLLIGVISSVNNKATAMRLTDVFADMIAVSSTSNDFRRMSEPTKGFLEKLDDMLFRAETYTSSSELSSDYRTTTRDNVLYITMTYMNVRYLVATRASIVV